MEGHSGAVAGLPQTGRWTRAVLGAGLVGLVLLVFGPTVRYGYVNLDDDRYIVDNPIVQRGLTRDGLRWAFGYQHGFWIPLTWVSYMAECEAGPPRDAKRAAGAHGCNPAVHHATNVALHAVSTLVLFALMLRLTSTVSTVSTVWRSAVVAAIFAVHPLHVESVAWITERKDVLSTCLGLLSMLAYVVYVRRREPFRATRGGAWWYGGSVVLFALSLIAKPMFVTMPALLLLLDYWPLERARGGSAGSGWRRWAVLLREKIPFVVLSIGFSIVTTLAWRAGPDYASLAETALLPRVKNALVAYGWYIHKHFVPLDLGVHYPFRFDIPMWQAAASGAVVAVITVLAIVQRKRLPYFTVGWLWFVGTLLPVAGLIRYGGHAYADRFSYVPSIGLSVAVVWAVAEGLGVAIRHEVRHDLLRVAGVVPIACLTWLSMGQVTVWKDSITLFEHAVKVSPRDGLNHHNLGEALVQVGREAEAIEHFLQALRVSPARANTHNSLGNAYNRLGKAERAVAHFDHAIRIDPNFALAYTNLAGMFAAQGDATHALELYKRAAELEPADPRTQFYLANSYRALGQYEPAVRHYRQALALEPTSVETRNNLALVLLNMQKTDEAITELRSALRIAPMHHEVNNNLGVALYSQGKTDEAILCFRRALAAQPQYLDAQRNLSIAIQGQ
jgi:tetratricopeptide (TPR) repeat protein